MYARWNLSVFFVLCMLCSCSRSPIATGVIAEENKYNMAFLKVGMSKSKVYQTMGCPRARESHEIDSTTYEIWFYLTRRYGLGQTRLLPQNLTPLIFKEGHLLGWGKEYYNYLLNIENEREKRKEQRRQGYTDDEDEWPLDEHRQVPEPAPQEPLPILEKR